MYNQKGNLQRISVILFENKNNFSHKNRQPTIARLLTIASILVLSAAVLSTTLVGNSFAQAANNNNTTTSTPSTKTTSSGAAVKIARLLLQTLEDKQSLAVMYVMYLYSDNHHK